MIANSRPGLSPMAPVFLVDLFPGLHAELMDLLRGLAPADWSRPTACALWSVKDIAAHLLDSGVRRLSFGRDRSEAAPDTPLSDYSHLVAYLNRLNAEWITAARRLSPQVLIDLLDFTGGQVHAIREAVGAPGLVARRWLQPTLDIFVRALPFAYREVEAPAGSSVRFEIRRRGRRCLDIGSRVPRLDALRWVRGGPRCRRQPGSGNRLEAIHEGPRPGCRPPAHSDRG